jgi:hypothetical protein
VIRRLALLLLVALPICAQTTYRLFTFTGTGPSANVFTTATSNDGATWTNSGGSWSTATSNVNAPTCIYYKAQWLCHVAAANDQNINLYTLYIGSMNSSNVVTTIATLDWSSNIAGLTVCFAGEFFVDDDGSLHLFVPCTTSVYTSLNSGWKTWETHPTNAAFTTWSAPVDTQVSQDQMYDSSVFKIGSTYYMWLTQLNGSAPANFVQRIELASSSALLGPYTLITSGDWAGWQAALGAHEGPFTYRLTNGTAYYWRIMIERLSNHQMYYADCNKYDFSTCTWTALTAWTEDQTYRHGTVRRTPLSPGGASGVIQ